MRWAGLLGTHIFVAFLAAACHREASTTPTTEDGCTGARCVEQAEAAMYYGDHATARAPLAIVCDNKDGFACYRLAELHKEGKGGPMNLLIAATLYEKACEYEHFEGCKRRSELARDGNGGPAVELDYAIKGCEGRLPVECIAAAQQLSAGRGVDRDNARAIDLYEKACGYGDSDGCLGAGDLLSANPKSSVDVKSRALANFISACVGHNGQGCLKVGIALHEGLGAPVDVEKARMHFNRACEFSIKDGCEAVKQLDEAGGKPIELELTTTAAELGSNGLETRDLSCRMPQYGLPVLDDILSRIARHKSKLDECAAEGAAVAVKWEFEKGRVQSARVKGKPAWKIQKCVKEILEKVRIPSNGTCEAVFLLGDPAGAAASLAARIELAAKKGDGRTHIRVTDEEE